MRSYKAVALVCLIALAASMADARAQTASVSDAEISAKSASMTDEERTRSQKAFSVGFELWQNGDCNAAVMAFRRGLDIDPANPQANFYYGDCLQRLRRREEAAAALRRALKFGDGTPEGYKAQAALESVSKPPALSELSGDEKRKLFIGVWAPNGDPKSAFTIEEQDGKLVISGEASCFLCAGMRYFNLEFLSDSAIRFGITNPMATGNFYRFKMTNPDYLEGTFTSPQGKLYDSPLSASRVKQ
ncbi:MAG: tetratricopeptide repeat protein [Sulfuritalea sp.]|jgi:tetratricopeptide (TPR) repeat protein|nr:tetratricopeptide repeat protein [Sulfuritalea sp.]